MSILKTVGVFEWSTDYRCEDCKLTFNVSDDSNAATLESKGHKCVEPYKAVLHEAPYMMTPQAAALYQKSKPCSMGVGCDEYGVCYADAHGEPDRCPR